MPSVAQIDGLNIPGGAPAFTGLLDETYGSGAAVGYSVRRLASATTVLLRIRRVTGAGNTGNDDEADVGFDSNNVLSLESPVSNFSAGGSNATTLGEFLNVGTVNSITYTDADSLAPNTAAAYVDGWKDQSGNGNDAEQGTPANQPQIHDGTADTDLILENGKPVLQSLGASTNLFNSSGLTSYDPLSVFSVSSINNRGILFSMGSTSLEGNIVIAASGNTGGGKTGGSTTLTTLYKDGTSWDPTRDDVYDAYLSTQILTSAIDVNMNASSGTQYNLGTVESFWHNHNLQEFVIYPVDQDTEGNRLDIEANVNADYLIYQPTTQPTSGLLYDYGSATGGTDAAAAYSVRQLSDKAVLCMRIRRDMGAGNPGDDDEINIGFDANGDLDTQAISDFCGTGTGYVTRWWDQSVNGNHADQDVPDSQPQIYNGTAVIEENGKPAVDFDGTDDGLSIDYTATFTNISIWSVHAGTDGAVLSSYPGATPKNFFGHDMTSNAYRSIIRNAGNSLSQISTGTTSDVQVLHHMHYDRTNLGVAVDGGTLQTVGAPRGDIATSSNGIGLGVAADEPIFINGTIQEVILYNSDEASSRTGIETNIDTYYQIPGM